MTSKITSPRGTSDILPDETPLWLDAEARARDILQKYGYREIRTPFFEETDLFARCVGQTSDIVQKQMLNLAPQGGEAQDIKKAKLSLRPEGTAGVARAYIQSSLDKKESLSKLFYIGPMFRGERPQKGRLRQFHQIGVEAIGPASRCPYLDAEVICLSLDILSALQVKGVTLKINTLGTQEDKGNFSRELLKKIKPLEKELCPDCQDRLKRNVFRILDCKNNSCQRHVRALSVGYDHLSQASHNYFSGVKEALDKLHVKYTEDPYMVRGLDYYTHTVFEISADSLGSQDAVGAGGRYNRLIPDLGGPEVGAVGFALGLERILLSRPPVNAASQQPVVFFLISLDEISMAKSFELLNVLRKNGVAADMSYKTSSMKSQMRSADKTGCRFVAIMGEEEVKNQVVTVKDMKTSSQQQIPWAEWNADLFNKLMA